MAVYGVTAGRWSSTRGKVLAGARIGVLAGLVPPGLADEVLAAAGTAQRRFRAVPGRLGVYFVLGLCLFSHLPYPEVVRELASGLEEQLRAAGWGVPASTALTRVRRRLGEKPFELLFSRLCSALSPGRAPWSHICGLLAVAWDGTTIKAWASGENTAAFGKPGRGGTAGAAYPQLRLVTLIACGTRALAGAAFGPRTTGERALAASLLGCLRAGMLLLADRGFYSYRLWQAAAGTGAHLLWRLQGGVHLPVTRELPDGSWLSKLTDPAERTRRHNTNKLRKRRCSLLPPDTGPLPGGIPVRVIEFFLAVTTSDGVTRTERYLLITTLTDCRAAPARDLAAGYAWRWAIETGFREFKTYLRGPGRLLRGRTPALARQELWAYLIIYQAIRAVICAAAASRALDPDRISFTATLHAIRRTLPAARTRPRQAARQVETDILSQLNPRRDGRLCIRAVNEPTSAFPSRNNHKDPAAQHADYAITITPRHQEKQPTNQANQPP